MFGNIWCGVPSNGKDRRDIVGNLMPHRCADWHGLIESSEARSNLSKNFDVLGFPIFTVTVGLANQSWWITWLAFLCWGQQLYRVQITRFKSGRNDGSCLTSTLNTITEGQRETTMKCWLCPNLSGNYLKTHKLLPLVVMTLLLRLLLLLWLVIGRGFGKVFLARENWCHNNGKW